MPHRSKMAKSSEEGRMLRGDYRFGLGGEKKDPWVKMEEML
jgi:hypothetical protein